MARKYVIALIALKGGAGKSTAAISMAVEYARRGWRVLIIDLDDQQRSARKWLDDREALGIVGGPQVVAMYVDDELDERFADASRGFDVIILDTPARLGRRPVAAMEHADLVVMPCGPNGIEVKSMHDTFAQVTAVRHVRRKLDAAVLITRKQPGTVVGRTAHRAYDGQPYQPLETELEYRLDYGQSVDAALGPTTWAPEGDAAREVVQLCNEVSKRLGLPMTPQSPARPRARVLRLVSRARATANKRA